MEQEEELDKAKDKAQAYLQLKTNATLQLNSEVEVG